MGYGSNIDRDRFLCYIVGGQPAGSQRSYEGCRDNTPPVDDKPIIIDHELYFSKRSSVWENGGVGFINVSSTNGTITFARMYLVTRQQLADIAKQETSSAEYLDINLEEAIGAGSTIFKTNSWYGRLIHLGNDKGYPVFTLTNETNLQESTRPSPSYLRTIIRGINQIYELKPQEIVDYLVSKRGISSNYTREELKGLVEN